MKLYEYAVIKEEKIIDKNTGEKDPAMIVLEPETCLARDDAQAQMIAARAIPDEAMDDLDRLTVVVRPF